MRLHRFFVEFSLSEGSVFSIPDSALVHQWRNVFRFRVGTSVVLLDNSGWEYVARITHLGKKDASVEVLEGKECDVKSTREMWLCVSLVKKDKFEWIVEKGTELGVTHFVPLLTDRSEKKNLSFERLKKVAKEAAEQSGRGKLPTFSAISTLPEAVEALLSPLSRQKIDLVAFHHEAADRFYDEHRGTSTPTAIFTGPEGGWSDEELALFKHRDIRTASLGSQVLKTETAVIIAAAFVLIPTQHTPKQNGR